ncbi:hypothetical protein [Lysinibacillus sp. G01H]|uniref:hypothetical protein n=1 Tax=Lysinibacillus sp. G01H TaxID=3026425 RepID=UPI00237DF49A|nr:hypothetical protein [Lysinibacillus sp. G01H]WDU78695.1 hypothetical protein PSR12_18915 [Lysinibacillus sp. G01H]
MFFNLFRRKNNEEDTINMQEDVKQLRETTKTKVSSEIPFEDKIIYLLKGKEAAFPRGFEKEKYFTVAKEVYESSNAKDVINKVEITNLNGDAGHCLSKIKNNRLHITIRIDSFKLGIVSHSGFIDEYSDEKCNVFTNILAHELVHAEDDKRIVDTFGIEEYEKIRINTVACFGKVILSEYSACRKTALQYGDFESPENIEGVIVAYYWTLPNVSEKNLENRETKDFVYALRLNYAIATRCAFADVSQEKEEGLYISSNLKYHKEYTKYILSVRNLLRTNYEKQPLDEEEYQKLGQQIMSELATIYSMNN